MIRKKNSLEVSHNDKEIYRIFKDLERYGRCSFSYPSKQNKISRSIAVRGKDLIKHKPPLLWPPVGGYHSRQIKEPRSFIQLPRNVKIVEKKGNNKSWFEFRIDNIL